MIGKSNRSKPVSPSFILILMAVVMLVWPAQTQARQSIAETKKLLQETPIRPAHEEAGAVILLKEGRMRVDSGGLPAITVRVVGKVLDDKAARDYGQIVLGFNSFFTEASLAGARTVQADGTVKEVSDDAVQLKTMPEQKEYSDRRLLTFALPGLVKGAGFEYEIILKEIRPIIAGKWIELFNMNLYQRGDNPRIDPVVLSRVVLDMPEGEMLVSYLTGAQLKPRLTRAAGRVVYTWELTDLPAIALESNTSPENGFGPMLSIGNIQTWSEVQSWASGLFLPGAVVTSQIEAKAREVTRGLATDPEKIAALFLFVEKEIRYIAAEINRGGYRPHPAHEVLQQGYGDCKDQAVLLVALLRAINIEAHPALVESYPSDHMEEQVPSPLFPHMIVYVPSSTGAFWLDTTQETAPFPFLPWGDRNKLTLVIDSRSNTLVRTPLTTVGSTEGVMGIKWEFQASDLVAELTITATGDFGGSLKAVVRQLNPDQRKQFLAAFADQVFGSAAKVQVVEVPHLDDPQKGFSVRVTTTEKGLLKSEDKSFRYRTDLSPLFSFFAGLQDIPPPEYRKNDYWVPFPYSLTLDLSYGPPSKAMRPVSLPVREAKDTPFFSYSAEYRLDEGKVRATHRFALKETLIRKEQYSQFYRDIKEVVRKSAGTVLFSEKKELIEQARLEAALRTDPGDVQSLVDLSKTYLAKGKYEEARDLLGKALPASPQSGEVHYYLGLALGYLDRNEESRKELETARKLGFKP